MKANSLESVTIEPVQSAFKDTENTVFRADEQLG